jgi:hypothetical protein
MSVFSERLRQAIGQAGLSINQFHRLLEPRLKALEVAGGSYGSIHRYLAGDAEPSLEWCREAGQLLNVSPAWLAMGRGSMSPQEQPAAVARGAPTLTGLGSDRINEQLSALVGVVLGVRGLERSPETIEQVSAELEAAVLSALEPVGPEWRPSSVMLILTALESSLAVS